MVKGAVDIDEYGAQLQQARQMSTGFEYYRAVRSHLSRMRLHRCRRCRCFALGGEVSLGDNLYKPCRPSTADARQRHAIGRHCVRRKHRPKRSASRQLRTAIPFSRSHDGERGRFAGRTTRSGRRLFVSCPNCRKMAPVRQTRHVAWTVNIHQPNHLSSRDSSTRS